MAARANLHVRRNRANNGSEFIPRGDADLQFLKEVYEELQRHAQDESDSFPEITAENAEAWLSRLRIDCGLEAFRRDITLRLITVRGVNRAKLREHWNSRDPHCQLIAALIYAVNPSLESVDPQLVSHRLGQLLVADTPPRVRATAALGLILCCDRTGLAQLRYLKQALALPSARRDVLVALAALAHENPDSDVFRALALDTVSSAHDDGLSERERLALLTIQILRSGLPEDVSRRRLENFLANAQVPIKERARLLSLLVAKHAATAANLLRSSRLDAQLRLALLDDLDSPYEALENEGPDWATWKPLIIGDDADPRLGSRLLTLFPFDKSKAFWEDLFQLARQPGLSMSRRCQLYRLFWFKATTVEAICGTPVFPVLLDLARDPAVPGEAFTGESPPAFKGQIDAPSCARVLDLLRRDNGVPVAYKRMLMRCIPARAELTPQDRRLIIHGLIQADVEQGDILPTSWLLVCDHARQEPTLTAELLLDRRIPAAQRVTLVNRSTRRQDVMRFARTECLGLTERERIANLLSGGKSHSPWHELAEAIRDDNDLWREIRTTPAFVSDNVLDLIPIIENLDYSTLCRALAGHWLEQEAANADDRERADILGNARAWLRAPGDDDRLSESLRRVINQIVWRSRGSDLIGEELARTFCDREISVATRESLLQALSRPFIIRQYGRLCDAIGNADSPDLQTRLLDLLIAQRIIPRTAITRRFRAELQHTETAEERAHADRIWHEVGRLAEVLDADVFGLLRVARSGAAPKFLSEAARHALQEVSISASARRQLWQYAGSAQGAGVWEESELKNIIATRLGEQIAHETLCAAVMRGPSHPLWPAVAALAQLPDQALVTDALQAFAGPSPTRIAHWSAEFGEVYPAEAALAAFHLFHQSSVVASHAREQLARAFARARAHHPTWAELLDATLRAAIQPPGVRKRIVSVLESYARAGARKESREFSARQTAQVLRYAQIEALLAAYETGKVSDDVFGEAPDLTPYSTRQLVSIDESVPPERTCEVLRASIATRLDALVPDVSPEQIDRLLQKTIAPAVLAVHYQRVHVHGLPLLGEALRAELAGEETFRAWRYQRPVARLQLAQLTDDQVIQWSTNLEQPVTGSVVSPEVTSAAARLRARFRSAVMNREVPEEYRPLIVDPGTSEIVPAQWISRYRDLRTILGKRIGGTFTEPSYKALETLLEEFPGHLRSDIEHILRKDVESSAIASPGPHSELLALRRRVDRAIDVLRLVYCDARALAQNNLRAEGEPGQGQPGAVAHLERIAHAFRNPAIRQQQGREARTSRSLDAACDYARETLRAITSFAPSKTLVVSEASDFCTLVEIGQVPYGQGSCQSYLNNSQVNQALLAYVVDAMTKAIVVRTPPSPENPKGTIVARAIVRLGSDEKTKQPLLVVEKTYAAASDRAGFHPIIQEAARSFAEKRGWRAGTPGEETPNGTSAETTLVRIPASQNGTQYEDGEAAIVEGRATDTYVLRVRYLGKADGPKKE